MTLTIDGRTVPAEGSLLDAVLVAGVDLPHLCKDGNLPAIGACRTCLVEDGGHIVAACSLPAAAASTVETASTRVRRIRRTVLELTAGMRAPESDGVDGGPLATTAHDACVREEARLDRFVPASVRPDVDASSPFFAFHEAQCILCGRCAAACQSLQHIGAIGLARDGQDTRVTAGAGDTFDGSICTACGSCVAACPTTALRPREGASRG